MNESEEPKIPQSPQGINTLFKRHQFVIRDRSWEDGAKLEVFACDFSEIRLNLPAGLKMIYAPALSAQDPIQADAFEEIFDEVKNFQVDTKVRVFVITGRLGSLRQRIKEDCFRLSIAVVDGLDLQQLVKAPSKQEYVKELARIFCRDLGRQAIQPYQPKHPAIAGAFFGREGTIAGVMGPQQETPHLILGNRRVGKTSLMRELQRRFRKSYQPLRDAWLHGNDFHDTLGIVHDMTSQLLTERVANELIIGKMTLYQVTQRIREVTKKERVIIFLDEVDHVLEFDQEQNHEVLHLLRDLSQVDGCRVFMAGYRRAMESRSDENHPLYNFGDAIVLYPFKKPEGTKMIREPLELLDIPIDNDMLNSLHQLTAGHPELIQVCCKLLVQIFEESGNVPPARDLLNAIYEHYEYESTVLHTFNQNANAYEVVVGLALIKSAQRQNLNLSDFEFDWASITKLLSQEQCDWDERGMLRAKPFLDSSGLQHVIDNLRIGSVIIPAFNTAVQRYKFAVPTLQRYLYGKDIQGMIDDALRDIKRTGQVPKLWLNEPVKR